MSDVYRQSEYAFKLPVDTIDVVANGEKRTLNLRDYINDKWTVSLSFAVGQSQNYVTFIEVE